MLPYIDVFLLAPFPSGRVAMEYDCATARSHLTLLFKRLGLLRQKHKGCWAGATVLEHLGMVVDTELMKVFATEDKMSHARSISKNLLGISSQNARLVLFGTFQSFCGVFVSLSLALSLAWYYTRPLYTNLFISSLQREDRALSSQRRF